MSVKPVSLATISTLKSYKLHQASFTPSQVAKDGSPNLNLTKFLITHRLTWCALLRNPRLSAGAFNFVTKNLAQLLLDDYTDLAIPAEFLPITKVERENIRMTLKDLATTGRLTFRHPAFVYLYRQAAIQRLPIRRNNAGRWYAFDVIIASPYLPDHMLGNLATTTDSADKYETGRRTRIATHPARTKATYLKIAKECTDVRTAEYMAWDPFIRSDPALKDFFAKFAKDSISIQGAFLPQEEDTAAKTWLQNVLGQIPTADPANSRHVDHPARVLLKTMELLGPKLPNLLSPSDLQPMVMFKDREIRLGTLALLSMWDTERLDTEAPKPIEIPYVPNII